MTRPWNWAIAGGAASLLLSGGVLERSWERAPSRPVHPAGLAAGAAAGVDHLRKADEALGQGDLRTAMRELRHAYGVALASPRWEALVAVGDAYRRLGETAGARGAWKVQAREAYLLAFFRARRHDTLIGMLRVGDAFDALGDREAAERAWHAAVRLQAARGDAAPDR